MDQEQPLQQLPEQLASLVKAVAMSSVAVVKNSKAIRTWPALIEESYSIPFAKMNWRMFFSTITSNVVFFLFRSQNVFTSVDARISASLLPAVENSIPLHPALRSNLRINFPVFLVTGLTDEEFALFAPTGASRQDTVVLALDPEQASLLAIFLNKVPRVRFSPDRVPGPEEEETYSLAPLLNVIELLGRWDDKQWPLAPPIQKQAIANDTINSIVDHLVQAHTQIGVRLSEVPPAFIGTVDLSCRNLSNYGAELSVSLKADGSLATSFENEIYVVTLKLTIPDTPGNTPELFPHFLVLQAAGPLYDSIFETLLGDGLETVAELLDLQRYDPQVRGLLARQFLSSARSGASLLSIERHSGFRKYLAVFRGQLFGHVDITTLICTLELAQNSETSVSWFKDGISEKVALFQGSAEGQMLDKDSARNVFSLFASIKEWKDLL